MKKFVSSLLLIALVISVSGCGSDSKSSKSDSKKDNSDTKTLVCSAKKDIESLLDYEMEIAFDYNQDKKEYTSGSANIILNYSSDAVTDEDLDEMLEGLKEECSNMGEEVEYYSSCDAKRDGNKLIQTLKIDLDKFDAYDLEENDTLEKLKETIEKDEDMENITCEIK